MGQKRRRFREDFDQGAVRPAPDDRCGGPRRGGVRLLEGCGRPAGHFHEVSGADRGSAGKGGIPPQRAWRPGGISSDESAGGVYPGQYPPADRGKSGPGGLPGDGGERLRAVRRLPDPGLLDGPVCGRERICRPLHPGGSGAGGIGETGESVPTLHRLNGKTPASYRGRRLFEKQVSPSARRSRRAVRRASPARGRARGGRPPGFPWPPWESRGDSR